MFKRLLSAFGVGGPTVDTVLSQPHVHPGGLLEGRVELMGGENPAEITEITLALVTRAEAEIGDEEYTGGVEFARVPVAGGLYLAPGQHVSIPFSHPVPWQAPVSMAGGAPLPSIFVGLRTEVAVAGALDKGDLDQVHVHPLPVQDRILAAMIQLGFGFKSADVETGHLPGAPQTVPFYQEIEFHPAPQYASEVGEVELVLVADPSGVSVGLTFDHHRGGDGTGWFRVEHADADRMDWPRMIDTWVVQSLQRHREFHGYQGGYHGGYHHEEEERGGFLEGAGGIALGVAGGIAAGYVAAEVIDEIGDAFEEPAEELEEAAEEFEEAAEDWGFED